MSLNDTTYGWDVSNYQADLTEQHFRNAKNEGIEFSIALATDGTGFQNFMFTRQLDWGRKVGMLTSAYHYVRDASISAQIANIKRLVPKDCPVIPDAEHGSGGINVLDNVVSALLNEGYRVPLEYLPRWYWQIIGSPWLGGRGRPLWASWYPDYVRRAKEAGAAMLPASVWNGYGGQTVAITQFTSSGAAAGYPRALDLNKFRGTRAELAALLGGNGELEVISNDDLYAIENRTYAAVRNLFYDMAGGASSAAADSFRSLVQGVVEPQFVALRAAIVAVSDGVTEEELREVTTSAAMAAAEKQAALVSASIRADLKQAVEDALRQVQDADNLDEAKKTADQLLRRIGGLFGSQSTQEDV